MTGFIHAVLTRPRSIVMVNKDAATVCTQNYLMVETAGLAVDADSGATVATIKGVCNQTIAAAEALTQVPVIQVFKGDQFVVNSTNNSNVLHNGQLMVIGANAYTVNNTGTTDPAGVVKQVGVFGATGDKKIIVEFV
jgi:hypothetical protein